jgi:hypothetical protein
MAKDKKSFKETTQSAIDSVINTFNINTKNSNVMHTNVTFENAAAQVTKNLIAAAGSQLGIPQASSVTNAIVSLNGPSDTLYATSPLTQRWTLPWAPINDFRTRYGITGIGQSFNTRLDGVALLQRRPTARAAAYAALSAAPGGVYSVFGLDSFGVLGYGWGDHGNVNAFRNDFTRQSHLASKWNFSKEAWVPVKNPLAIATPFRGDKVNMIDYKKTQSLKRIYDYRPSENILGLDIDGATQTQDFIKFFFTGPKLAAHTKGDDSIQDDVIVFRATIGSISDQFQPSWTPVQLIGRADPNYHYSGYSRDISLDFTVYATDRDEMKPIWRKLNALAGYTAPDYSGQGIGFKAPWMRITIGDLFYQVPVVISSLSYTLGDTESPWEINIEGDPDMMEAPMKVQVSIAFHLIGDWLPQKGGQFYTLSKRFDKFGSLRGSDNWLSDTQEAADTIKRRKGLDTEETRQREAEKDREERRKRRGTLRGGDNTNSKGSK